MASETGETLFEDQYTFTRGKAYNVSGNEGVQLELTNGKRILIGSQRADELADAIKRAKQVSPERW